METEISDWDFRLIEGTGMRNLLVVGTGTSVWDIEAPSRIYSQTCVAKVDSTLASLLEPTSIVVKDNDGRTLTTINGPFRDEKSDNWEFNIYRGAKHYSKQTPGKHFLELVVGQDEVVRKAGGGIVNLARGFVDQTTETPFLIATLRGDNGLDKLVEGTMQAAIRVEGKEDSTNIVIKEGTLRDIVRGSALSIDTDIDLQTYIPEGFNIGTVVIDSLDVPKLMDASIALYRQSMEASQGNVRCIAAITPKMKKMYEQISRELIANRAIAVFSSTDMTEYAFRDAQKGSEEYDIGQRKRMTSLSLTS